MNKGHKHLYDIDGNINKLNGLSENTNCTFIRRYIHAMDNPNVLLATLEKVATKLKMMDVISGELTIYDDELATAVDHYFNGNPKFYLKRVD